MHVIGIDLGGTKVAAGLVTTTGKILVEKKLPSHLERGWPGLKQQLLELITELKQKTKVKAIGIGSAGPLHAPSGKLLDPTNFGWPAKVIPIAKELQTRLKIPVRLENDAAAAVLAESWKGSAGKNCIAITLGTGLGVGTVIDGKLHRGARGLHAEVGHLLLRPGDPTALCGCGNYGCSEAFLSGTNFAKRVAAQWKKPGLKAEEIVQLAASGHNGALAILEEYSQYMADFLHNLVVLYYPEKVILCGSFAQAHPHFLPQTKARLRVLLERRLKTLKIFPEIRVSRLGSGAGILGAAYVALHKNYVNEP